MPCELLTEDDGLVWRDEADAPQDDTEPSPFAVLAGFKRDA